MHAKVDITPGNRIGVTLISSVIISTQKVLLEFNFYNYSIGVYKLLNRHPLIQ